MYTTVIATKFAGKNRKRRRAFKGGNDILPHSAIAAIRLTATAEASQVADYDVVEDP